MAEIDSLEIKISSEAKTAISAVDKLSNRLGVLADRLKFDTSSLEKLGNISGNNFKNLGDGIKSLSDGLKNLQNIKKSDFNRLANGVERLSNIKAGNMEAAGNALAPLAQGISALSNANFDNKNLQNLINILTRLSNANFPVLQNIDFSKIGESIKGLTTMLSSADKVQQNTIIITNAIAKLANAGQSVNITAEALPNLASKFKDFFLAMSDARKLESDTVVFAQALAQLANAGKKTESTASGIPQIASSLKDLMKTLSTAPQVSQNTIRMTQTLANLAAYGGRLGGSLRNINSQMSGMSGRMSVLIGKTRNLTTSFKSLAKQLLGSMGIYVGIYGAVRGMKNAIKSSMDYIEVLNYFDAAFGQVAEKADLSSFKKMGYDSAESYYSSFASRAEKLTAKMSGFTVDKNGMLQATGGVSLGLDPSQLMNYQAMFGQMSSSMGVASETSLKLSQALTEIGADLASVKNMDFEKVWEDMASGLAGMSRTLDKYGVNIRNVNLQQKLNELGIEANISALNQNDKALLRAIILLDSTRYAWADLADTINQPANQLRLIEANFQNLSRTIGSLFLPLVQKVLPYVNALVIALQRLFSWLANLIGIDLSGISTAIGGADLGDVLDQTDELAGGLGDAKKAADKLNKSLQKFDELNVISTKQDSDSATGAVGGIGGNLLDAAFEDVFSEYQKVWDEAFANLENRAQEIADGIEKAFEPVKKIIQDLFAGKFELAGKDTSALAVGIFDFFADAIDRVDWYGVGQKMGEFLAGIDWTAVFASLGNLIWQAIKTSIELWAGSFSKAPFETAFLSILALPAIVGFGSELIKFIVSPFTKLATLISPAISAIGGLFAEGGVFGVGGIIATASTPVLALTAAFAALVAGLTYVFATNEEVRESFSNAVDSIRDGLQPAIQFFAETLLPDLKAGWDRVLEILTPLGEFLEGVFTNVWQDMINPALTYIGETVLPMLAESFGNLWNNVLVPFGSFLADVLEPVIKIVSDALAMLWENVVVPLADAIGNVLGKAFEGLVGIFNYVVEKMQPVIEVMQFLWDNVLSPLVNYLWETLKPTFETVFNAIGGLVEGLGKIFGGLIDFIVGVFTNDWSRAWEGIKDIFKGIWNGIVSIVEGVVNIIIGGINDFLDNFDGVANAFGDIIGIDINIPDIPELNLPKFAKGGITLKHTFAEIGELNKPEAVIPLTNTKAMGMIAESIVSNIDYSSMQKSGYGQQYSEEASLLMSQNQLIREQNELLRAILNKPTMEIGELGNRLANDSWMHGGNTNTGGIRLAVASELYG